MPIDKSTPNWLNDGEKYALIGLDVNLGTNIANGKVAKNLWVMREPKFIVPTHWKEWLGTIRVEQVEQCGL